ncbi:hypothetical protein GCM10010116_27600 [Microbispora rosea subsp. aerata]|nr:hypothetical protein GCM10010116_27600 [Microbispora rosea subsp. aerata]GIH53965.1 hypothetical protein Mro02_08790 [Microbispora rosea subsp. aerata]GLJ84938.1 hypothetical protein GCM10017588_36660 [Microbispora rosea subsp. aerata]
MFQAALDAGVPVRPVALRFAEGAGERAVLSTRPSCVGDDTLLASLLRIVATRDLVAEVTVFPAVRLDHPGAYGERARRGEARAALARIAEAQVKRGSWNQRGRLRRPEIAGIGLPGPRRDRSPGGARPRSQGRTTPAGRPGCPWLLGSAYGPRERVFKACRGLSDRARDHANAPAR